MRSLSVVLPFYNEERNIEQSVFEILDFLKNRISDYEIILIDDGSTDNSLKIVQVIAKQIATIKLIVHPKNLGYGRAIKSGFKAATKEAVFFTDADRQFDIRSLELLLPYIDKYHIVTGFRVFRKDSYIRIILSKGYNIIIRALFGLEVKDVNCAFKIFQRKVLDAIEIESKRYTINTEILAKAKALNFSIFELGVNHLPRLKDSSKVSLKDIPRTLIDLLRIRNSINTKYNCLKR